MSNSNAFLIKVEALGQQASNCGTTVAGNFVDAASRLGQNRKNQGLLLVKSRYSRSEGELLRVTPRRVLLPKLSSSCDVCLEARHPL